MTTIETKVLRKALIPIKCLVTEKTADAELQMEFRKGSIKVNYVNQARTGYGTYEWKADTISKSLLSEMLVMTYGKLFPLLQGNKSLTFSKVKGKWYIMKDNGTKVQIESIKDFTVLKDISNLSWNTNLTVVKTTGRELKMFNLKHFDDYDTMSVCLDSNPRLHCGIANSVSDSITLNFPEKKGKDHKADYGVSYMRQIIARLPTSADVELGIGQDDSPLTLKIYEGQGTLYLAPEILREE